MQDHTDLGYLKTLRHTRGATSSSQTSLFRVHLVVQCLFLESRRPSRSTPHLPCIVSAGPGSHTLSGIWGLESLEETLRKFIYPRTPTNPQSFKRSEAVHPVWQCFQLRVAPQPEMPQLCQIPKVAKFILEWRFLKELVQSSRFIVWVLSSS